MRQKYFYDWVNSGDWEFCCLIGFTTVHETLTMGKREQVNGRLTDELNEWISYQGSGRIKEHLMKRN